MAHIHHYIPEKKGALYLLLLVPGGSNTHNEILHWPQASTAAFIRIQCITAKGVGLAREKRVLAKAFLHLTNPWLSKSLLEPLAADSKSLTPF